ncbi:MAG: T9SS type A sorting domain-containing protein [Taibaiella sp.]|nr:T9SS type A sorting domain-containing protein [Taibaiella sp.]
MKKITLIVLLCLITVAKLFASHARGGEIRYEYHDGKYTVSVTTYRTCGSIREDSVLVTMFSSCDTIQRYFHYKSTDTVTDAFCASSMPGCGANLQLLNLYSDTVTLPPCSDWKMTHDESALYATVSNIAPENEFISAGLNNSAVANSSPLIANRPPFYLPATLAAIPVNAADAENDSLDFKLETPQTASDPYTSHNMTYNAGYSATHPLPGSYNPYFDPIGQYFYAASSVTSECYLQMRVTEYRGGTAIGYFERAWITQGGTSLPKQPYLYTAYTHNTSPGMTDSAQVTFLDSTSTDSVFVSFVPGNSWTYTSSGTSAGGYGTGKIKWTTPASATPGSYFYIYAHATTKHCPLAGSTWYPILIHVSSADSVWPGDADDNKVVNMTDALYVGLQYGKTGPVRTGATTSWVAQYVADWSSYLAGINAKFADCDGNGTVNVSDLGAITANYGLTHPRGSGPGSTERKTGLPDLYFDLTGISMTPGATVHIPIMLGSTAIPVSKLYGIAASVKVIGITPPAAPSISTPATTWVGSTNTFSFTKQLSMYQTDWAYCKTDHMNSSGQGQIGTFTFTVPSDAAGKNVKLYFENVKVVDNNGNDLTTQMNIMADSTMVSLTISNTPSLLQYTAVLPNPSAGSATLRLSLNNGSDLNINITDIAGKTVWHTSGHYISGVNNIDLPAGNLVSGMYFIHLSGKDVSDPVIKWIKE